VGRDERGTACHPLRGDPLGLGTAFPAALPGRVGLPAGHGPGGAAPAVQHRCAGRGAGPHPGGAAGPGPVGRVPDPPPPPAGPGASLPPDAPGLGQRAAGGRGHGHGGGPHGPGAVRPAHPGLLGLAPHGHGLRGPADPGSAPRHRDPPSGRREGLRRTAPGRGARAGHGALGPVLGRRRAARGGAPAPHGPSRRLRGHPLRRQPLRAQPRPHGPARAPGSRQPLGLLPGRVRGGRAGGEQREPLRIPGQGGGRAWSGPGRRDARRDPPPRAGLAREGRGAHRGPACSAGHHRRGRAPDAAGRAQVAHRGRPGSIQGRVRRVSRPAPRRPGRIGLLRDLRLPHRDRARVGAERPSLRLPLGLLPADPEGHGGRERCRVHALLRRLPRPHRALQRREARLRRGPVEPRRRRGCVVRGVPQHRAYGCGGQRQLHDGPSHPLPRRGGAAGQVPGPGLPAPPQGLLRPTAARDPRDVRGLPQAVHRQGAQPRHAGAAPEPVRFLEGQPLVRGRRARRSTVGPRANVGLPRLPHAPHRIGGPGGAREGWQAPPPWLHRGQPVAAQLPPPPGRGGPHRAHGRGSRARR
jgi:hypothetical protein